MNNRITFLNEHWFWPVVIMAFVLLAIFIGKEFHVAGKRRIILKVVLSVLAIGSLVLIALKPAINSDKDTGAVALVTPGYESRQLDSLKGRNPGLTMYTYDPGMQWDILQQAREVYILGYGVKPYDLYEFEHIEAMHLPVNSPEGVVRVKFPAQIAVGEEFLVRGLYRNPREENRLVLSGPGGAALDSTDLDLGEEQYFQLSTPLKMAGNYVYYLTETNKEGAVVSSDPLPVSVEEKKNLRILVLNQFPTFETKYLKNYLAEAGHELIVRSQITRGRFNHEYFNTARKEIGNLSRESLKEYDLLIIDAPSWRGLSANQSRGINSAMREDGLGIFIQPDQTFFGSPGTWVNLEFQRHMASDMRINGIAEISIPVFPYSFSRIPGLEEIHRSDNTVVTAYRRNAQGRLGSTVLTSTWHLVLDGKIDPYKELWAAVVEQLAKREDLPGEFLGQAQVAFPHEPYHFQLRSTAQDPVVTHRGETKIPLARDIHFPDLWHSSVWPREEGWNRLAQDTSAIHNYFVAPKDSWGSLTAQNTLDENTQYFTKSSIKDQRFSLLKPVNPIWFFVLFLMGMGGLWLEPKIG